MRHPLRRTILKLMKSSMPTLIVLGAGRGSRYLGGGHKLARSWRSSTVLGQSVANAVASGLPVKVITTESLVELVSPLVARRDIIVLPEASTEPRLGMGYSIASGVRAALDSPGWLVLPADMPLVTPQAIRQVAQALGAYPVAYAQHQGRRGHPVGFSAELVPDLVALSGDEGARRVIARYPAHAVDVEDPGVLLDFDTLEDFKRQDAAFETSAAGRS